MRATIKILLLHTQVMVGSRNPHALPNHDTGHRALPPAVPTLLQHFSDGAFPVNTFTGV